MNEFEPTPDNRRSAQPAKGRGTMTRWPHRFDASERTRTEAVEWPDDEVGDVSSATVETTVTQEMARSILSRNDSPDIPFRWSINPYRGCEHGCIYCYARPTHSYLNLSPGLDFETRLVAKVNAAALLRKELSNSRHVVSAINIGSATDPYQPVERSHRLTRSVIEVLLSCLHPFTLVTKSGGVMRDIDLLSQAARQNLVYVLISITTLDDVLCRRLEPRASAPARRLSAVRQLTEAGIPVGVNVAPIIPFLNEPEIERIVEAAAQAGARSIHYTTVRLPWEVRPLFEEWLQHHVPDQAERIMARVRDLRGGKVYDADFSMRMKGQGVWADLIAQRVRKAADRHGVGRAIAQLDGSRFDPRMLLDASGQMGLF